MAPLEPTKPTAAKPAARVVAGPSVVRPSAPVASTASAPAAKDALLTAPRAAQPAPVAPLGAVARMAAERPSFDTPEPYKAYVLKFKGFHDAAKREHAAAQAALAAERGRLASADAQLKQPLDAATRALEDARKLHQEPIDRLTGELRTADAALQDAIYPGRRQATQLDGEAARIAQAIGGIEDDIARARRQITTSDAAIASAMARRSGAYTEKSDAESRIRSLEPQAASRYEIDGLRTRVSEAGSRLRQAEARVTAANAAVSRMRELESQVASLDRTLGDIRKAEGELPHAKSSAAGYKGHVTRAQHGLDAANALPDADATKPAKLAAARAEMNESKTNHDRAESAVDAIEARIARDGGAAAVGGKLASLRSQLAGHAGAERELAAANEAMGSADSAYDAIRRRLTEQVTVTDELDRNRDKLAGANRLINDANATIGTAVAQREQANRTIGQLQDELETKTRDRNAVMAEAGRERIRQNPASQAQVVTAQKRVTDLQGALKAAQAAFTDKTAAPKAKVDAEAAAYATGIQAYRDRVAAAERTEGAARQAIEGVNQEYATLKDAIGGMKATWWKLRYRFDVKEFLRTQGPSL